LWRGGSETTRLKEFSAVAFAASVPLNTMDFMKDKTIHTVKADWNIHISGGVLRKEMSFEDFEGIVHLREHGVRIKVTDKKDGDLSGRFYG